MAGAVPVTLRTLVQDTLSAAIAVIYTSHTGVALVVTAVIVIACPFSLFMTARVATLRQLTVAPVSYALFQLADAAGALIVGAACARGVGLGAAPLAVKVAGASLAASGQSTAAAIALAGLNLANAGVIQVGVCLTDPGLIRVGGLAVGVGGAVVGVAVCVFGLLATGGQGAGAVVAVAFNQATLVLVIGVGQTVLAVRTITNVGVAIVGAGLPTRHGRGGGIWVASTTTCYITHVVGAALPMSVGAAAAGCWPIAISSITAVPATVTAGITAIGPAGATGRGAGRLTDGVAGGAVTASDVATKLAFRLRTVLGARDIALTRLAGAVATNGIISYTLVCIRVTMLPTWA